MSYDPTPSSEVLLAAGKALEKQLGKFALEPGSHPIDAAFTVHLAGVLEKAKECQFEGKAEVPWPLLLTLLCKRAKLVRSEAKRLIAECAAAAISLSAVPETAGFPDRLRDAEDALAAAVADAPKIPKSRQGATKWLGTCTIESAT